MPWVRLKITDDQTADFARVFSKKSRFQLDADVDPSLAPVLRGLGWNTRTASEAGLLGHPDENVLALAKRDDRILITHDRGFLDERRHPPNRNPGVIVIPQPEAEAVEALGAVLPVVAPFREIFRGTTIQGDADGTIKIRQTDYTGARITTRYRYGRSGVEVWEE